MNENPFNTEPGFQENQLLDNPLADTQYQSENEQVEDLENRDTNVGNDFPDRTHQHDYKNPSADQFEIDDEDDTDLDDEDEVDTDSTIFDEADVDEQSPDVLDQDER